MYGRQSNPLATRMLVPNIEVESTASRAPVIIDSLVEEENGQYGQ